MKELTNYDCVILDCDGVILDSNEIKTEAFRSSLSKYDPKYVDEFIAYHQSHGGVSRQDKFKYFFKNIISINDHGEYLQALNNFQTQCMAALMQAKLVPGVEAFLQALKDNYIPVLVLSGGNEDEIKQTFKKKKIFDYFDGIYGNPVPKDINMENLFNSGAISGVGLFAGDAELDYKLASRYGMEFVFIHGYSEWNTGLEFCEKRGIEYAVNFDELMQKFQS